MNSLVFIYLLPYKIQKVGNDSELSINVSNEQNGNSSLQADVCIDNRKKCRTVKPEILKRSVSFEQLNFVLKHFSLVRSENFNLVNQRTRNANFSVYYADGLQKLARKILPRK